MFARAFLVVCVALFATAAFAQDASGPSFGGGGGNSFPSGLLTPGAADDLKGGSNEDVTIHSLGSGRIVFWSEASQVDLTDNLGSIVGNFDTTASNIRMRMPNLGVVALHGNTVRLGSETASELVCMSHGITSNGVTQDDVCFDQTAKITLNGTTPTLTATGSQVLHVRATTGQEIDFDRGDGVSGMAMRFNAGIGGGLLQSNGGTAAAVRLVDGVTEVTVGAGGGVTATSRELCSSSSITALSAGTRAWCVWGNGIMSAETVQTATCSAATVSVDPQSAVITIDSNAGNCTATITNSSNTVTSINQEILPVRITAKNVGAGTLKIASTNFASIPSRCSSTGLSAGQSLLIAWSKDQAKWIFLGGCE